eukprot:1213697-Rhodomonas_salina.1
MMLPVQEVYAAARTMGAVGAYHISTTEPPAPSSIADVSTTASAQADSPLELCTGHLVAKTAPIRYTNAGHGVAGRRLIFASHHMLCQYRTWRSRA